MRNYIIINGINSLTIPGLAINIMPPITKAPQRNLREEIDGRDGDLVTKLGYGAYDKALEVGLFGDYDIDQVIAFFNSEGKITFSTEPDKVYNFQILDVIDFAALQKFRTATITIHCQPFKYPLNEAPIEIQNEYLTGEGESITLQPTKQAPMQLDLKGNTSQDGTPTPSSPVDVNVVSGDNTIEVCGKNLFNPVGIEQGGFNYHTGAEYTSNSSIRRTIYNIKPNTQYTISCKEELGESAICCFDSNNNPLDGYATTTTNKSWTFTTKVDTSYIKIRIGSNSYPKTTSGSYDIFLVEGTATTYEPYKGNTYPIYLGVENAVTSLNVSGTTYVTYNIDTDLLTNTMTYSFTPNFSGTNVDVYLRSRDTTTYVYTVTRSNITANEKNSITFNLTDEQITNLKKQASAIQLYKANAGWTNPTLTEPQLEKGSKANSYSEYGTTPIELCKIGTYQDYIYKENGSWYLHKEIGKYLFNGTETWDTSPYGTNSWISNIIRNNYDTSKTQIMSNIFRGVSNDERATAGNDLIYTTPSNTFTIRNTTLTTSQEVRNATNGNYIYYALATPTTTEITDTTLISQLEATKESQDGVTNISQENNDLPFIINASALKEGSGEATITNGGNIYSKPTIELEGTGVVDIFKDGSQSFQVDLTEKNHISIDTQGMEATDLENGTLANRQVTGDYSKFFLDPGEAELSISGELTKATITKYTRWL